jgi:hypothetical protein
MRGEPSGTRTHYINHAIDHAPSPGDTADRMGSSGLIDGSGVGSRGFAAECPVPGPSISLLFKVADHPEALDDVVFGARWRGGHLLDPRAGMAGDP